MQGPQEAAGHQTVLHCTLLMEGHKIVNSS